MVLPRGTRVIVQRLPAARGHGCLARMARADAGIGSVAFTTTTALSGFYTIDCRSYDDEEFVSALLAGRDPVTATSAVSNRIVGGKCADTRHFAGNFKNGCTLSSPEPELRDQERMCKKQKRAKIGVPLTLQTAENSLRSNGAIFQDLIHASRRRTI